MLGTRRTTVAVVGFAAALGLGGVGVAAATSGGGSHSTTNPGSIAASTHLVKAKGAMRRSIRAAEQENDLDDTSTTLAPTTTMAPDTSSSSTEVTDTSSTTLESTTTTVQLTTPSTIAGEDDDEHGPCADHGDGASESGDEHQGSDDDAAEHAAPNGAKVGFTVVTPSENHGCAPLGTDFGRRRHGDH